jgi:hypothetical protein
MTVAVVFLDSCPLNLLCRHGGKPLVLWLPPQGQIEVI